MRERYLSWTSISPTTDDGCLTRGVVYDTKWSLGNHRDVSREESCDGVYFREFYLFLRLHSWEDTGECLREHGLTTAGRSLHDDIMSSGCCDDESAFRLFLSMDTREVYGHGRTRKCRDIELLTFYYRLQSGEHLDDIMEGVHADDIDIGYHRGFADIFLGEEYISISELAREYRGWESSLYGSYDAIEGEFSEKE